MTKELEADTHPTIHVTGRVLLWLALVCEELDEMQTSQYAFVSHAKDKLVGFLDDPAYMRELAIA